MRVAGMRVGDVGEVELEEGKALVRMDLDPEYDDLVRRTPPCCCARAPA